jgi:hypothetical protein
LTKNTRLDFIKWLRFVALINDYGLFANKIPYACGYAPLTERMRDAQKVQSTPIWKGQEFSLFGFLPAFCKKQMC